MNSLPEHVVVAAEDAGSANVLAAYIAENGLQSRCHFVLSGPSIRLFSAALGHVPPAQISVLRTLDPAITLLVCGTGLNYRPTVEAIRLARTLGIRSAALLDHWTNFACRFGQPEDWRDNLADEIWVTDQYAWDHAVGEGFPPFLLKIIGNAYSKSVSARHKRLKQGRAGEPLTLLYVSELMEEAPLPWGPRTEEYGYNGHSILLDIIAAASRVSGVSMRLLIRLDPAEAPEKYDGVIAAHQSAVLVSLSSQTDLAEDLALSDLVVAAQTAALAVAHEGGIPSVSYIPGGGIPCQLPHSDLVRLRNSDDLARHIRNIMRPNAQL